MKFDPITANADLDIHPDPPPVWENVAVVCRWKDARAQRKQWPHASVIGPLRTVRGVDEFFRNLLHNPQINCVIITGSDLTPGEETTAALMDALTDGSGLSADIVEFRTDIFVSTSVHFASDLGSNVIDQKTELEPNHDFKKLVSTTKRAKVTIPPAASSVEEQAPAGDPGERVAADTLAELWPMVLHRVLRFGRSAPTQHGETRELLCLTSVVRDVEASLADLRRNTVANLLGKKHPVLGLSWPQVEAYFKQIDGTSDIGDREYSYGSRMRGRDLPHKPYRVGSGFRRTDNDYKVLYDDDCCQKEPSCVRSRNHTGNCDREEWWENKINFKFLNEENDQIVAVERLLGRSRNTRSAFLTPWRPAEDCGKDSGRPCMTGVWFRVEQDVSGVAEGRLHVVVSFRSHDLFAGWPLNLSGIMLWQESLAENLGLGLGTLTCTSYAAHIYERDVESAENIVKTHYETYTEPAWDQRSSWHVEIIQPEVEEKPVFLGETLEVPRSASGVLDTWRVQAVWSADLAPLYDHIWIENTTNNQRLKVSLHDWRDKRGDYRGPKPEPRLRATALTPDGKKTLKVFEADTPEALRGQIERSGLVTSIGAALWLGDEIRKLSKKRFA